MNSAPSNLRLSLQAVSLCRGGCLVTRIPESTQLLLFLTKGVSRSKINGIGARARATIEHYGFLPEIDLRMEVLHLRDHSNPSCSSLLIRCYSIQHLMALPQLLRYPISQWSVILVTFQHIAVLIQSMILFQHSVMSHAQVFILFGGYFPIGSRSKKGKVNAQFLQLLTSLHFLAKRHHLRPEWNEPFVNTKHQPTTT
jgi:hypothetical protein